MVSIDRVDEVRQRAVQSRTQLRCLAPRAGRLAADRSGNKSRPRPRTRRTASALEPRQKVQEVEPAASLRGADGSQAVDDLGPVC